MKRNLPKWMLQVYNSTSASTLPIMKIPESCKVVYSHDEGDCCIICSQILATMPSVIGFDMEWVPFTKASQGNKTAVIQICTEPNNDCFVFHISKMGGLPSMLRTIVESETILKTGIGVGGDLWKLHRDFNVNWRSTQKSFIDLNDLAKSMSVIPTSGSNWSLQALTEYIFQQTISKSRSLQLSNWESFPLSSNQIHYAALDAYLSLTIYKFLRKKKFSDDCA